MLVKVVKIGKAAFPEYESLVAVYEQRLNRFCNFQRLEVKATHGKEKKSQDFVKENQILVCLDERGTDWSSKKLSDLFRKWQDDPRVKEVCFVIGGPYGLSEEIKKEADHIWCLASGTLPSDMAWLIATEQIYRAFTILKGIKYHHI